MYKWIWGIPFALALLSANSVLADEPWRKTMKELARTLSETVPYLFTNPVSDQKKFAEKIRRLDELTKKIDIRQIHSVKYPDDDPALPYIAEMFHADIVRAEAALQSGHLTYAQGVLKSAMGYCMACHTRNVPGAQFPMLDAFKEPLKQASWIERTEIEAATRQYDTVISRVMAQLKDPTAVGMNSLDLERGARLALSILVRIKKDPARAKLLAKAMEDSGKSTFSMKEEARAWQKDIGDWQSEKADSPDDNEERLQRARRLIGGDSLKESNAEVRYLRATVVLHDLLQRKPDPKTSAEALSLIGKSYRNLGEIGLWNIHELYFAACIDAQPHSPIAENCYRDYQESVILGYSGSSGIHLPKAVRDQLEMLKEKAKVRSPDSKRG
jgi:hypothetical protein